MLEKVSTFMTSFRFGMALGIIFMIMGLSETPNLLQMVLFPVGFILCIAGCVYEYIGVRQIKNK